MKPAIEVPDNSISLFSPSAKLPRVAYAFHQKNLKGEDAALTAELSLDGEGKLPVSIHAVFDGHNGVTTASFCQKWLVNELMSRLPSAPIPPETDKGAFEEHLKSIRQAVADTFAVLDQNSISAGCNSGCTASLILVTGWLCTIANVGDSDVLISTQTQSQIISQSHRLSTEESNDEILRLKRDGHVVARLSSSMQGPAKQGDAGIGALRVWPGGLSVSRAIGDVDCGATVLAIPHIRQIVVPSTGARFLVASDGVWDGLSPKKAAFILRSKPLKECPAAVVKAAIARSGLHDDTSCSVIDVMPSEMDFGMVSPQLSTMHRLLCIAPNSTATAGDDIDEEPLRIVADVDMLNPTVISSKVIPCTSIRDSSDSSLSELIASTWVSQRLPSIIGAGVVV